VTTVAERLSELVASLDDRALEALGSRGLLRRARRDLERGVEARIVGDGDGVLHLRLDGHDVTIPVAGPASATCGCPASGACHHLLAAVLLLQSSAPAVPSRHDVTAVERLHREVMMLTPEALEHWAGAVDFRAAARQAQEQVAELSLEPAPMVRLSAGVVVHLVPGAGLAGAIASGPTADVRKHVVAAVLAWQALEGRPGRTTVMTRVLAAPAGAPRDRGAVLAACRRLLEETLACGLARLSAANQQRWASLAVSARGVELPRLARLLRAIGDEGAAQLAHSAQGDAGRLLARMAEADALCAALERDGMARSDLVGVHRAKYEDAGDLELVGVAAWPWRTPSGHEGLTVLFWEPATARWSSWTDARPVHQRGGFVPQGRFSGESPWEGAHSPRQLAASAFTLRQARRNGAHRLSGSSRSRVVLRGPARLEPDAMPVVHDWAVLREQAGAIGGMGLREASPLDAVVVVRPSAWRARRYDAAAQRLSWELADVQERTLLLELPYDTSSTCAIEMLEQAVPAEMSGALVAGRLHWTARGLALYPFSVHRRSGDVVHLHLTAAADPSVSTPTEEENEVLDPEEELPVELGLPPALARLLDEMDDALLSLAESGLAPPRAAALAALEVLRRHAGRLGLAGLATALGDVVTVPSPRTVLRATWVAVQHRRAAPRAMGAG
jgi:hypothetical protein